MVEVWLHTAALAASAQTVPQFSLQGVSSMAIDTPTCSIAWYRMCVVSPVSTQMVLELPLLDVLSMAINTPTCSLAWYRMWVGSPAMLVVSLSGIHYSWPEQKLAAMPV